LFLFLFFISYVVFISLTHTHIVIYCACWEFLKFGCESCWFPLLVCCSWMV
jgi:hypothetical protein